MRTLTALFTATLRTALSIAAGALLAAFFVVYVLDWLFRVCS